MYIPIDPLTLLICLGLLGVYLLLSAPMSAEDRIDRRERRQSHEEARARQKAALAVEKAQRQAWRRRVFGSHPMLYGWLAWLGTPVTLCLLAIILGW